MAQPARHCRKTKVRHLPILSLGQTRLLLLILSAFFAFPELSGAQSAAAVFDSAGACYESGDYDCAVTGYSSLVDQGYDDPRIWYNLGNAEFKAGRLGYAIKAYLRARRLAPRDPDINANLQFVRLYTVDKLEESGRLFILGWADLISAKYTLREWLAAAGVLFSVLILLTILKVWFGRTGRAGWYWFGFGLFLWLLIIGGAARHYRDEYMRQRGVVVVKETDVRGGPGDDYTLQFTGHDGLLFTIDRQESGWYLVSFENGVKGWVIQDATAQI
jgi:tetratricopeptide (TPR) repeat protein